MGTTTVSLSILAGITFGFLYLIISGIKWASERLENGAGVVGKDRCSRCGVLFRDVDEGTCSVCGLTVCIRCAIRYQHSWLCSSCIVKTDENLNANEWVLSHFKRRFESTVAIMRQFGKRESDVRDFVEKLTEHLVGGRLDNVRIDRVCSHPNYMKFMDKYEQVLSLTLSRLTTSIQMLVDGVHDRKAEQPKSIHQQLKSLINEIIDEANNLDLSDDEERKMKELRSKTYEDILAIAVLNKVMATERSLKPVPKGRYENLELINCNNQSLISELESEFEDLVRETGYHDWNDNWVLEKKQDSCSSSVTMLIPSPIEEAKPRIGDIEVDELSDLSDVETDPVHDIEEVYHSSLPRDNLSLTPIEDRNGRRFNGLTDVDDIDMEYNHYREPAIPSIVEARNNVFRSLDRQTPEEEAEFEMREQLRRLSRRSTSKVKVIEQAYSDRFKSDWQLDDRKVSVRNLAKQFSSDGTPLVKYSEISLEKRLDYQPPNVNSFKLLVHLELRLDPGRLCCSSVQELAQYQMVLLRETAYRVETPSGIISHIRGAQW